MQRLYEWRGHFGSLAMAAVGSFWESDPRFQSADERAAHVALFLSSKYPFIYSDVEIVGGVVIVRFSLSLGPFLNHHADQNWFLYVEAYLGDIFESFD
jgi:hypothetical protein